ncbi:PLP-dependent aminotransferase family protein [Brevibacillus choshinensis]|uniref:aminotransferase-like domain-containing protein n=1 Tax=Brevibacillus choshinensis TaxID=54911 RepID=UPI002E248D4F|nr:PLP-dependent aminotransferase family protein [Brevibacillus choshinensis]MED4753737.1 PLP-dependent aminotransferase family protein [Brevibacillus choshinensis]MED4781831.1 PLP-dependent aminotransferase family protein [Brevibacillus choshinensis]
MSYRFAERTKMFKTSAIREIGGMIQKKGKDVISFAGGNPYEPYFPNAEIKQAFERVFESGNGSLQYGLTTGFIPLRAAISERIKSKGIQAKPEDILLTTGSQQSIDLLSRVMLSPGDVVLTENPTFLAAVQSFESYEAKVVAVEGDKDGMDPEDLERKIKQYQPKFIYVVPTFSNPDGKVWSEQRRVALLELAYQYNTIILEDDPYGDIQFHAEEKYTPIAAMDHRKTQVVYTSSFSKTVVPSLRIGWVTGPDQVLKYMSQIKEAADLMSSPLDQQALYYLLRDMDLDAHIRMLSKNYYQHMSIMQNYLKTLDHSMVSWVEPKGGMFIWVKVHESINATELLAQVLEHGVAFIPGAPFFVEDPQQNTLRLNFTHSSPEKIQIGMERLTLAFKQSVKLG